jgi:hypothetical protein
MAISEQCSRESSALRSDYYSTTEKTANPLNEWWTTPTRDGAGSTRRRVRPRPHHARFRRDDARIGSLGDESKKCLRHSGFRNARMTRRRRRGFAGIVEKRARMKRSKDRRRRRNAVRNFFHRSPGLAAHPAENALSRANQCQVIRGRAPLREVALRIIECRRRSVTTLGSRHIDRSRHDP